MDYEQYLRKLYYGIDSPTAFTGKNSLLRKIKQDGFAKEITGEKLDEWLQKQYTYSLHKTYRKPSVYRRVLTSFVDDQWQADLLELREFSDVNKGFNYVLCVIDCFSKYAWVVSLKTKTGLETRNAFAKIFELGRIPSKLQVDEGREFYNENVKKLLEDHKIQFFSTHAGQKASIVERFIRTIKSRLWKYFTANETRQWENVIHDLTSDYNDTFHTSIKMTPTQASLPENSLNVFQNLYHPYLIAKHGLAKFKVGETVRISKYKKTFDKGYLPNYTEEFFKIKQVHYGTPTVYSLEDLKNESVSGIFYEDELSAFTESDETSYKVEQVLAKKTVKGKKMLFVSYMGWPEKFNEWIPAENVTNK
jgi:hypothetical protein